MDGPKVFADITFIVNFTMDFIILWATAKISGVKPVYSRIGLAAALGGIYAVGYLFPELHKWYTLYMKVFFSCVMVIIGLWPSNWTDFKKIFLYFYGINFMVAGASIAASYLFSADNAQVKFSYFWLLGGIFCALGIGIYGEKYLVQRVIPHLLNYHVELRFDQMKCNGKGLLDTGNRLRDPLTNKPVIVAEYNLIRSCLPEDFVTAIESNAEDFMVMAEDD
jgi:stage II sporulation protein GA (sporulation sigma-E factor processing peptidase)